MKRKFFGLITFVVIFCILLTGCGNKDWIDFGNNTFNYAYIQLQDGTVVQGKVQSWTDYEGEQLQIKMNGKTYLTSSFNCTLVYDPTKE